MKTQLIRMAVGVAFAGIASAASALPQYNVDLVFMEPDTVPQNTIFSGSFSYDAATHTVSGLQGFLTESMTGTASGAAPYYDMIQLQLTHQLASWYDSTLGGSFAAVFLNDTTATFSMDRGGDGWSPASGVANTGQYASFPGNAYALIFVPDDPLAALTQAQIDKLAYADCAPGGMMGITCMTGTSLSGYGSIGTMSGYPLSQTITAAVPEPETYAMFLAGLGLLGAAAKRRRGR